MRNKKSQRIELNTRFKRSPKQMFSEIDDEIILLSIDNSEYYNLNKIGSQIWHLLENETSYKELIRKLMQGFDVSEEACMQDTHSFLSESVMKGIIQIIDE